MEALDRAKVAFKRLIQRNVNNAYRRLFDEDVGALREGDRDIVLDDLRQYCFMSKSTFDPSANDRVIWIVEGRRQVALYIQSKIEMSERDAAGVTERATRAKTA